MSQNSPEKVADKAKTPKTLKTYAHVEFTDATGTYGEGDVVTLPYETDADKSVVEGMVAYGIVGTEPKAKGGDK